MSDDGRAVPSWGPRPPGVAASSFDPAVHPAGYPPPPPASRYPGGTATATLPPPSTFQFGRPTAGGPAGNGMATASLVLGLCSLLLPLLLIPGFILGIVSLRRIRANPALGGRGRSIAGIVTSLVLGALSTLGVVALIIGATSRLDMNRVQSSVQSLVQSDVEQHFGVVPVIDVQCPNSEPRAVGTTFSCDVVVPKTGARFTTQLRETDSRGDFIVGTLEPVSVGTATPVTTPVASPVAPTPPTVAVVPAQPAPLTGSPSNGEVAVIAVDAAGHHLTLEPPRSADVTYATCAQFQAVSSSGTPLALSALTAGEFATDQVDATVPCVSRLTVLATPAPPQCSSTGGSGAAVVTFEGYNPTSHAVLFLPSGPGETIGADRWCSAPTIVGANGAAMAPSQIPKGAQVQLLLSENGWVTGVTVRS
jgi:hypothetical protein